MTEQIERWSEQANKLTDIAAGLRDPATMLAIEEALGNLQLIQQVTLTTGLADGQGNKGEQLWQTNQ